MYETKRRGREMVHNQFNKQTQEAEVAIVVVIDRDVPFQEIPFIEDIVIQSTEDEESKKKEQEDPWKIFQPLSKSVQKA